MNSVEDTHHTNDGQCEPRGISYWYYLLSEFWNPQLNWSTWNFFQLISMFWCSNPVTYVGDWYFSDIGDRSRAPKFSCEWDNDVELPNLYNTLNVQQVMYSTLFVQHINVPWMYNVWMYNNVDIQHLEYTTPWMYNTWIYNTWMYNTWIYSI